MTIHVSTIEVLAKFISIINWVKSCFSDTCVDRAEAAQTVEYFPHWRSPSIFAVEHSSTCTTLSFHAACCQSWPWCSSGCRAKVEKRLLWVRSQISSESHILQDSPFFLPTPCSASTLPRICRRHQRWSHLSASTWWRSWVYRRYLSFCLWSF